MTKGQLKALRVDIKRHEARGKPMGPMEINPRTLKALLRYVAKLEKTAAYRLFVMGGT